MRLYTLGINHHTAPVSVREQVAFGADKLPQALVSLTGGPAREAAILSTCNRTEVYCAAETPEDAARWLADFHRLPIDRITQVGS